MMADRNMDPSAAIAGEALPRASMAKVWGASDDLAKALVGIARGARAADDITDNVRNFWALLDSPDGANVKPGDLESWDDVQRVMATLVFMKLTHSLTRCFQNTAPIFMNKLAMPSTLRNLPKGKPGFTAIEDIADIMAGSRDTVDDMGASGGEADALPDARRGITSQVTGAALSFPAQNLWHEDRPPMNNADAEAACDAAW